MKTILVIFILFISLGFLTKKVNIEFNSKESFKIIELEKEYSFGKKDKDSLVYKNWELDSLIIKKSLASFSQITNNEWHYQFYHFPCSYSGIINQNGKKIKFEINAGSWFLIQLNDTTLLYGDKNKEFKEYFLETYDKNPGE